MAGRNTRCSWKAVLWSGAWCGLLASSVIPVLAPNMVSPLPDRDAGVFLYGGSRILEGEVPYRDFWDHKGPLIFYLNALGLLISPGSETGIWLIEALCLAASIVLSWTTLRKEFGLGPALLATAAWASHLSVLLRPGNYTEEFALPLLFGSLYLLTRIENSRRQHWWLLALGAAFACCLLLRPNNVGTAVAAACAVLGQSLVRRDFAGFLKRALLLGAGAAAVLAPTVASFYARGALLHLWDAVVTYNSAYLVRSLKASIDAVLEGIWLLSPSGLPLFGVAGWLMLTLQMLLGRRGAAQSLVVWAGLAGLPIDMLAVAIAGRGLNHYYILWLPSLSVLTAVFLAAVASELRTPQGFLAPTPRWIFFSLLLAILVFPARRLTPPAWHLIRQGPRHAPAAADILSQRPEQFLLMWGAEASYNFLADKPSPTRYVYQYPLYTCGYVSEEMVEEFAAAIADHRPLIVDTSPTNQQVPPIDPSARAQWEAADEACALTPAMEHLLHFLERSYRAEGQLEGTPWLIYAPRH